MNKRGVVSTCLCLGLLSCGGESNTGGSSSFGPPATDDGGDGDGDGNDGGDDGSGSGAGDDGGSGGGSGGTSSDGGGTPSTGGGGTSATDSGGVGTGSTGSGSPTTGGGTTTTGGATTTTGADSSSTGPATTTGATTGTDDCSCVMGLDDGIFVLSDAAEIYKYLPDTDTFNFIGGFNCPGVGLGDSTFSMAVDRKGIAWVMFNQSQKIYHIDLQTFPLQCTDPGYVVGQSDGMGHGPWNHYGMAFVSNSIDDRCDKLYGNTFDGSGFSEGPIGTGEFIVLDPDTLQVSYIGDTTFDGAELTGTADGRAYMFGGVNPAKLVEVDKTNGSYVDVTDLGMLDLTNAFAFAFFEGDFYFFTEGGGVGSNSKVTHLDFDDTGSLMDTPNPAPIRIVGAGVSTCVSIVPQ